MSGSSSGGGGAGAGAGGRKESLLVGCVGKPSAGKSSFLNAATDANAKVGKSSPPILSRKHKINKIRK